MRALDASSIIHAWDNYPLNQFPPLWRWLAHEVEARRIVICEVALAEVERKFPECAKWLKTQKIQQIAMTDEPLRMALTIKAELGIEGDNYHAKGVGENDILIVASASVAGQVLISNEERQPTLPTDKRRMKIPAVCNLDLVAVECKTFVELIKESGMVFGE